MDANNMDNTQLLNIATNSLVTTEVHHNDNEDQEAITTRRDTEIPDNIRGTPTSSSLSPRPTLPFINLNIVVPQLPLSMELSEDVSSASGSSPASSSPVEGGHDEAPSRDNAENDEDGQLCPICLDNWTTNGEHRICSLKCGHLFGFKCLNRWLESQTKKTCPTCKKKVNRGDLRYIYARKLLAVDTMELEAIRQQLDKKTEDHRRTIDELNRSKMREMMLVDELQYVKSMQVNPRCNCRMHQGNTRVVRLYMDKSLELCRENGCRVFDANAQTDLIIASMKSPMNLFGGYGIRKVNISQYKPLAFIPLHSLQIRDVCFHPKNNWVLTASTDKSIKVVDCESNAIISTLAHSTPLWSCCWDPVNDYHIYIGTQAGEVTKYDIRNYSQTVGVYAVPGDMSPVVSVATIPPQTDRMFPNGGILSCKLNSLWLFEDDETRYPLPLEGPFVSMKYQRDTKQLLVSSRPNSRALFSRHTVCTLEKQDDSVSCHVVHSFLGGGMQKLLSKSCFLSDEGEFVAAHEEANKRVHVWSINTGEKVCSLPAHESVLDLRGVRNHNGNFLVSLTERKLEFFKFNTF